MVKKNNELKKLYDETDTKEIKHWLREAIMRKRAFEKETEYLNENIKRYREILKEKEE